MKFLMKIFTDCFMIIYFMIGYSASVSSQYIDHATCTVKSITQLAIPVTSGKLLFNPFGVAAENLPDEHYMIRATKSFTSRAVISPDGSHIAQVVSEDSVHSTAVYNSNLRLIYSGASSALGNYTVEHWLGNEQILTFVLKPEGSDNPDTFSIESTYAIGYYIVSPFDNSYVYNEPLPSYSERNTVRFGSLPRYQFTYDGRYMIALPLVMYDFFDQRIIERENWQGGLASSTSYNFLYIDQNSFEYSSTDPVLSPHQVNVYNIETDTPEIIARLDIDRPIDFQGWSPDENYLAYVLDYGSEIVARPIEILDLDSNEQIGTCFSAYSEIKTRTGANERYVDFVYPPRFAWSRDSRYLALQGVLEGEDPDESLGVYIYDTQTSDIYEVYRGRADIIGWMAHPDS